VNTDRPEWIETALRSHSEKEIFSVEHSGERYWIKKGRPTGSKGIHALGYHITGLPFLRPVERKSAVQAAVFEAEKLRRLRALGLPVPEVVWSGKGCFAMRDTGEGLSGKLKRADRQTGERWLGGVVEALASLHRQGEYHGASQIRNFTVDESGAVSVIDFEESFEAGADLKALQFRDLFLLLYSLHRQRHETDYPALLEEYMERSGNREFAEELHTLYRRFRPLAALVAIEGVRRRLGSDAEILHRLFESIRGE